MRAEQRGGRRWWASIGAGIVMCAGCCAAPLLITAGILGGGTVLVGLSWAEPLGFALIGVGVAGLVWSRRRARQRDCGGTDSQGRACASTGCGCTTAAAGTPVSGI